MSNDTREPRPDESDESVVMESAKDPAENADGGDDSADVDTNDSGEHEEGAEVDEDVGEDLDEEGERPKPKGFTLLEVMVAVAILAMSLTSLLNSQMAAMRQMRYSQQVTAAAFLAEYQLVEIEWQERKEGWQTSDTEYTGTFDEQGWPDISYRCVVDFLELPEYNELLEAKEDSEEGGARDDNLQDTGEQAFSALGVVWPIVKGAIENSIRKASCTVYWEDGKVGHDLTVQTFWTDPTQLLGAVPGAGGEATSDDDTDEGGGGSTGGGATGAGGGRPAGGVTGAGGGGGSGIPFNGGRP